MTLLDANILLYAGNAQLPQHPTTNSWLSDRLQTSEVLALPWVTVWAFLRISTNPRLLPQPLAPAEAFSVVREYREQPGVVILEPGPRHMEILERIVVRYNVRGPLVTDAVLAAHAIEHGAILASADQGFSRFSELKWFNPLTAR